MGQVYGASITSTSSNTVNSAEATQDGELTDKEKKELEKARKANKNLSELEVEGYEIFPEFNKNTINYYVIIPDGVTSLDINAEPEMEGAIVRISGNTKLTKKKIA